MKGNDPIPQREKDTAMIYYNVPCATRSVSVFRLSFLGEIVNRNYILFD